jgi:hypothetical protein
MATLFRLIVEELGYGEVRVEMPAVKWHTGLMSRLAPSLLASWVSHRQRPARGADVAHSSPERTRTAHSPQPRSQ